MSDWFGPSNPDLDARIQGSPLWTATANTKTQFELDFDFACDFNGIEFYAWDSHKGDNLKLWTEYYAGPYGWVFYKKFGDNFNVFPNNRTRIILFPTKPILGVRLVVEYDNKGQTDVDFSLNKFQFSDTERVLPSLLQSGTDW